MGPCAKIIKDTVSFMRAIEMFAFTVRSALHGWLWALHTSLDV